MKKFKALLLGMLLVFCCGIFTACGMKAPTEDDIVDALKDEKYITKDTDYKLEVTKNKLNDDKNKAKVECKVVVKDGCLETTYEYAMEFKARDKKSWKLKECSESEERKYKLIEGISDADLKDRISGLSFYGEGVSIRLSDETSSFEAGKHNIDDKNLTDKVELTCTGVSNHVKYEMKVNVEFKYYTSSKSWSYVEYEVVSVEEAGYEDGYEFKKDAAGVLNDLVASNRYIYIIGNRTNFNSEGVSLSNGTINEIKYQNNYCNVDITFDVSSGDIKAKYKTVVQYSYASKAWVYNYLNSGTYESITTSANGTWTGSDGTNNYTIEIASTSKIQAGYQDATVTVSMPDGVNYSYKAYVSSYDGNNKTMRVSANELIQSSDNATHSMTSFSGKFDETGAFVPTSSSYKWSFTKQSSGSSSSTEKTTEKSTEKSTESATNTATAN